jgi:hypothetical protein
MTSSLELRSFHATPITFGKNKAFDVLFVILGGLPLYLPYFLLIGESNLAKNIPFDWVFWSNQLVSMPHVWATYARLNRKISEGKVKAFFGLPIFFAILALLIFATLHGFFLYVMTAVNVWQSYHYLRQVWGVSRYFTRPQGETTLERKLTFWAFHGAMPLFILGRWNMLFIFWNGKPSDAIIPVGFPAPVLTLLWILAFIALVLGVACEVLKFNRCSKNGMSYDCSAFITLLVYFGIHWYGFLSIANYFSGFIVITIFHAVQYLAITWQFEDKQLSSNTLQTKFLKLIPASASFVVFSFALYLLGDFIQTHIFTLGNNFWPQFAGTCLSTVSAQHYLVDTFMWTREAGM